MRLTTAVVLAGLGCAGMANGDIAVGFTADGTGRFIDHFSSAYAEVGLDPEGMYDLTTDAPRGPVDAFPLDENWADFGTLVLDGAVTPTSSGTFDIVGTTGFDFESVIDGNAVSIYAGFGGADYTTTFSNLTGTATLAGGVVTSMNFAADVTLTFVNGLGSFPYEGTITITESAFELAVDDALQPSPQSPLIRQEWAFTGVVATTVIPEPGVVALAILGAVPLLVRRRA